jgi:tRNA-specific 2-thiouridylase
VINIDILKNSVTVGPREAAMARELLVRDVNWLLPREEAFRASVKIRSMMRDRPATVFPLYEARARVLYDKPQWAPAPGQSAVFYEGDTVVGGGVIEGVLDLSQMAANPPGNTSSNLRRGGP